MGSAFDDELTREISLQIAEEARSKGVHVLLSPTLNLHRSPLGGRVFEFLSEDPYLAGKFASVYIAGVQSKGIAVCAKHFVSSGVGRADGSSAMSKSLKSIVQHLSCRPVLCVRFTLSRSGWLSRTVNRGLL